MSTKFKSALAKVEKVLGAVVGTQKLVLMEPAAFLKYAHDEIKKAQGEPISKAHARLSLLYKSVLYSSNIIEDEQADSLKVPVFVADQTTLAQQENEMYTPDASGKMNPASGTVFEQGFVAKMLERVAAIAKDVEAMKAGDDEEPPPSEDAEKAKKKPPMPPPPPGDAPAEKAKTDGEEEPPASEDTEKAKGKQPPPFPPPKKDDAEKAKTDGEEEPPASEDAEKKKAEKLAKGDAAWPDDMNDSSITESEWGND